MMGVSFVFMSDRSRVDYTHHGRYNDVIMWPVLGIGIAWLVGSRRLVSNRSFAWIVVGTTVLALELALLVNQLHVTQLKDLRQGEMVVGPAIDQHERHCSPPCGYARLPLGTLVVLIIVARSDHRERWLSIGVVGLVLLAVAAGLTYDYRLSLKHVRSLGIDRGRCM